MGTGENGEIGERFAIGFLRSLCPRLFKKSSAPDSNLTLPWRRAGLSRQSGRTSFSTLFPVAIMNAHEPQPGALIAEAAALRAAGQSWETIGTAVNRHADTVRRWPDRYRDEWCRTYRAVEAQLIADAVN